MARKNLLAGLTDADDAQAGVTSYPMRGAGKSLVRSLDELARQADKFLEGEAIVELDPNLVDGSFVQDRMAVEGSAFDELVAAIAERGQDSPILVRPKSDGRYQVVFGHRRLHAARKLGRMVRAVVKSIDDRSHVIAQGQENSARTDLSFAERASFARSLDELGYEREVIMAALSADASAVSKMLSVVERIGREKMQAIGPAASVGRERWVELSLLLAKPANRRKAEDLIATPAFDGAASDERFDLLYKALKGTARAVKKGDATTRKATWQAEDKAVVAEITAQTRAYSLSLKAKNAGPFGEFLSARLDALYAQFLAEKAQEEQ
ncbi:plasmid partitioning protein RepB [Rhizobium paknamense]|uniref:ParB family chromosome partitioning protein n=1 Tax=Rhizobium paknamense TaxID=1206817 RepID=A0ABU0IIY3_9HYPH|nr:plasmid partitioning protein RepB [Rhizobium paknamense]MDQ0458220.1 ParB family chromosome partitioning protein [Rhizobium paknamense]